MSVESYGNTMTKRMRKSWQPRSRSSMQRQLDPPPRVRDMKDSSTAVIEEEIHQDRHPSSLQRLLTTGMIFTDDP